MSRPNTRSKNKRQRTEDGDDSSIETLRKIHLTGEISQTDVRQLYLVWKPICEGCRGNSKDSPNCFCGFIPPSNGNRKAGLWQKMSDIIQSLGPNPCKDLRSSTDTPAGLTNLGATCYANSILQCLYMNTPFRAGIFSVEPDLLKQHPVLDQLARLFVQLHSSKMAFIDSAPFIKTLELDNGVQQDSHEFLTLFLSLLERSLSHSKISNAKTVVQDLFRGSVSHVTRCSVCGKDSDASSKMEDFYELELNIKGLNNLDESLDDYLSLEKLDGENQYFCESCGKRVDATRSIKLRSLPSVLNFQLKRYVFLPKTTTKKKITSAFSFPRRLNMGTRLCFPSESQLMYELSAILIHKGTAVNSGHYVAHIKDENSGQWWEFDDEHVSKLGFHPFGEVLTAKVDPKVQLDGSEKVEPVENGNNVESNKAPTLVNHTSSKEEVFSSTDAYMLMYTCVNIEEDGSSSNRTRKITNMEIDVSNSSLPLPLQKEIQELNVSYDQACEEYQERKDKQVSYITERREEVKSILSEAPVNSLEDSYFWISADWLRQWADYITPPYDLSSTEAERLAIRTERRKEYEKLRRQCQRLLKHRNDGEKEMKGIDDATNVESPNFNESPETPDPEDVLSARPSISIEQGSLGSSNRDQSGISHDASASKSDNLEEDQSETSHVDASASKSDDLEEDKSETRPDAFAEEESGITHVDASSVGSESSAAESSSEEETESMFTSAVEGNIEADPNHSKSGCLDGGTPKSKRTAEDFTTWQRIIRLDAIRANAEWIIYSPAQAAVSAEKAQECASSVGLKDYDHLEPCRIYHAARLVAILEAYALYDQEIGYCQGMSDLLSPILAVMEEDDEAFWCFVGFMRKARHNFRLDEVGIRRQLNTVSKIIKSKDSHLYRHLEKLQAEDCFFVYRMVVVLFRRELDFEQTLCLWEVMWADQAAIRAGIGKSAWGRMRLRAPPTEDLLLYAIAACVLQRRKLIIESYSSMDEIIRECNNMAGHLDVWKLLDDAHDLVVTFHDKI